MKAILRLDRQKGDKLLESREQVSRSYMLDFIRCLYAQQAQESPASDKLALCSGALVGRMTGIVVGTGTAPLAPTDYMLAQPILLGRSYKPGSFAQPINASFETGDFTGWTTSAGWQITADWAGRHRLYAARRSITTMGAGGASGSHYVQQTVNCDNISAASCYWQMSGYGSVSWNLTFSVGSVICGTASGGSAGAEGFFCGPVALSGNQLLKVYFDYNLGVWSQLNASFDLFQLYGTQLEFGGTEVQPPTFSAGTGQMTIRRFFHNKSGNDTTIREVGLMSGKDMLLRDLVSPSITLADGETLRVTYQMQITV